MTLVLASSSPRRRELLSRLGVYFDIVPAAVEERSPRSGEDPTAYARDLANVKAADVARLFPEAAVLGADTVVAVAGHIMGKPRDRYDAFTMLTMLRGQAHSVVTGVSVHFDGAFEIGSVAARVHMRNYTDAEIEGYIATREPMDKAGAYAVQGLGGRLVERVEGCLETVIGLPLCLTAELLQQFAYIQVVSRHLCHHTST